MKKKDVLMKLPIFLTFLSLLVYSVEAARRVEQGVKKTSKSIYLFFNSQKLLLIIQCPVCKRGTCVDYCDIEKVNLEPGETFEEDCSIVTCGINFTITKESCGLNRNGNCSLTADYSLKYPGKYMCLL